jgi:hypothetical protein
MKLLKLMWKKELKCISKYCLGAKSKKNKVWHKAITSISEEIKERIMEAYFKKQRMKARVTFFDWFNLNREK